MHGGLANEMESHTSSERVQAGVGLEGRGYQVPVACGPAALVTKLKNIYRSSGVSTVGLRGGVSESHTSKWLVKVGVSMGVTP